ncbi:MAG: glutamine--fructose-6-phosphate transaminase (isomerizing) [Gammaproteobacteria bacterium]|nr:MAG: glutamine--fructose-6-phosphate transaminase (isomerizing) [Gammaproteobacteria bacterium]
MCGIVGAITQRDVAPILVDGLQRLEYRGYDSAGIAVVSPEHVLNRIRMPGKVEQLHRRIAAEKPLGHVGVGHTRWATHGAPTEQNAHPHVCRKQVAVVHNGIIENHNALRKQQESDGYEFTSGTDTEVIVHQVHRYLNEGQDLLAAVQSTAADLKGAYALGVISVDEPDRLVAIRQGCPLVIGIGEGEHFIASDHLALLPVTQQFAFLEDGDTVDLTVDGFSVYDRDGKPVDREQRTSKLAGDAVDKGQYRHYMLKEIHEQPLAIAETLEGRIREDHVLEQSFGTGAQAIFDRVKRVRIIACGTSFHAGMVARNWFEGLAGISCQIEVASEFRYRHPVVESDTLIVAVSQSGETADTLAAVRMARKKQFGPVLAIVNVAESTLVREADLVMTTRAGPEIGVASTKAFTTQLVALLLLVLVLGRRHKTDAKLEAIIVRQLRGLPRECEEVLKLEKSIKKLSERFVDKQHALFLGRGVQYPVAMEGALKLKEISYIHAEAYPAGELKHGPLALVDADMPVIAVAPHDDLLEKLKSNLEEVRARHGELYVFADKHSKVEASETVHVIEVPGGHSSVTPMIYTIPLQLLAYYVAVMKGTDIDQPRNLAKSVTVE